LESARRANFSVDEWDAYERAKMAEQYARGALTVAYQEGELKARHDVLLRLLSRAGFVLTLENRTRILACTDVATLDKWVDNVLGAKSIVDVFL
jgi:hypothetical protein